MLGFVVRQLRHRRGRAATLSAGSLVAAASFVLLTSAAQTSELQVKGTVAKNFRAAYDILVRPKNSFTPLEKQPKTGAEIMELLLELRGQHGMTVLVATHDQVIASRCDRIVRLKDGRVLDDVAVPRDREPDEMLEKVKRLNTGL